MAKVNYIEMAFENCEGFIVEVADFSKIKMVGIKDAMEIEEGSVRSYKVIESLTMRIEASQNNLQYSEELVQYKHSNMFERVVKENDISSIFLIFDDGNRVEYNVNWKEYDVNSNSYQECIIGSDGALYINIEESPDLLKYFMYDLADKADEIFELRNEKMIDEDDLI